MKHIAIACVCIFLGFAMGRWTLTTELEDANEAMAELRSGGGSTAARTTVAAAQDFLRIDPSAREQVAEETVVSDADGRTNTVTMGTGGIRVSDGGETGVPPDAPDFEEQIEEAKELWRVRSRLARNSFLENLAATEEEAVRFDVLVESMNIRLKTTIDDWVERVEEQETIRAEDGARLFHEITGSFVLTYDELDRSMPEDWRDSTEDDFALFDLVDPGVADSLMNVEDLMESSPRFGPGRRE